MTRRLLPAPPGSLMALLGGPDRVAPMADGPQVLDRVGPAGLGLDDVIDLGGPSEAAGVPQLAKVAVALERQNPHPLPVTPVGVAVALGSSEGPARAAAVPRAVDDPATQARRDFTRRLSRPAGEPSDRGRRRTDTAGTRTDACQRAGPIAHTAGRRRSSAYRPYRGQDRSSTRTTRSARHNRRTSGVFGSSLLLFGDFNQKILAIPAECTRGE
jgi:hypothetical protein